MTASRQEEKAGAKSGYPRMGHPQSDIRNTLLPLLPELRAYTLALTRQSSEADDLIQETVMKALRSAHQFTPGTSLKAWLFAIARNTFRSSARQPRAERSPLNDALHPHVPPPQEWHLKMQEVDGALRKIPRHRRKALMLVACAGLSYGEVANVCGCSIGTVRSRIHRAREELLYQLKSASRLDFLGSRK